MIIGQIVLGLALLAMALILFPTMYVGVPPMPSSNKAMAAALEALPQEIDGTIYEMGAGWGHLARRLASKYPQNKVVGFELSPLPWLISKIWTRLAGLKNCHLELLNFMKPDLEEAGLVVCFLAPHSMTILSPHLIQRLRPGTLVLSNTFALPDWEPEHVSKVDDLYSTSIYLYRI